jgi:putative SOS response-associated peptidase YedK
MCGRFTQTSSSSEIESAFNLANVPPLEPRYNIAPTQQVATILRSNPDSDREFKELRWGLIPSWAKDSKIGAKLINARAETVAQKAVWQRFVNFTPIYPLNPYPN